MMQSSERRVSTLAELHAAGEELMQWLRCAYLLWWRQGADHARGGFHERLDQNGQGLLEPRRARLHPRQIYSFSLADRFFSEDLSVPAVTHGLAFYQQHYLRADGFYRALVAADGSPLSDEVVLYDQAFALLGLAAAFDVLRDGSLRTRAIELLQLLQTRLANPAGGFEEGLPPLARLTANSHMHLLEAAMAWLDLDRDERWHLLGAQLVELALHRLRGGEDGQIREFFTRQWHPSAGIEGLIVEPGHQFEWAWLLLRWGERTNDQYARAAAYGLITLAETQGVAHDRGVAINSMLANGTIHDSRARLWPQTERLKAACAAARMSGEMRYWHIAVQAAHALLNYLDTPVRGLWRDTMTADGSFIDEPAPASSFYHIVAAIAELQRLLKRIEPRR